MRTFVQTAKGVLDLADQEPVGVHISRYIATFQAVGTLHELTDSLFLPFVNENCIKQYRYTSWRSDRRVQPFANTSSCRSSLLGTKRVNLCSTPSHTVNPSRSQCTSSDTDCDIEAYDSPFRGTFSALSGFSHVPSGQAQAHHPTLLVSILARSNLHRAWRLLP